MLSIFRRHRARCKYASDRVSKKCHCALWLTGTLLGKPYRKTTKTRSWEAAERIRRQLEDGTPEEKPKPVAIKDALRSFVADCESRNLNSSTLRKYRTFQLSFEKWCAAHRLSDLVGITAEAIRLFRATRTVGPRTASKELERIRAFFNFCVDNDWLAKNPAKIIKAPKIKDTPTLPLTEAEVARVMAHAEFRTQVFFRVLLHSGVRIIDAAQLRPEKITDGKLFLYSQKTGVPVMCPLPLDLLADLSRLPLTGGFYFAVQSVNPVSISERYRQKLNQAAIAAGLGQKKVKGAPRGKNVIHPHRFRDTFAVRLLEKGVPLETVSILLGHTDIKTTQRSYAPWVQSLQNNLEAAVQKTWDANLVRVK